MTSVYTSFDGLIYENNQLLVQNKLQTRFAGNKMLLNRGELINVTQ